MSSLLKSGIEDPGLWFCDYHLSLPLVQLLLLQCRLVAARPGSCLLYFSCERMSPPNTLECDGREWDVHAG
jgi:hypothetical protein